MFSLQLDDIITRARDKISTKYQVEKLACWFEHNIPVEVQCDPEYVAAVTKTIVQCALRTQKVDIEAIKLYFCFLSGNLRTPSSLQRVILDTVYKTAIGLDHYEATLVILNALCRCSFVSVETLGQWASTLRDGAELASEIRTLCADYKERRVTTDQFNLKKYKLLNL